MALAYLLDPNQQLFTRGGVLNVGGLIKVYLNGTDDPAVTYSDFEGTANPFPVVLDSNGRAVVIADESMAYRVEVYGALGNLLWTSYPVVPRTYTQNDFTDADKEKLDGIEEGAQKNVKSDWNATSGDAEILNKPNLGDYAEKSELAEVAFTGDYDDLENRPTIPAPQVQADYAQGSPSAVDYIKNKPNLSPVATSGSYNDLSDTPNIPPAQVNSDWNANAGVSEILNKPDIPGMAQTTADALCELKANIEAVEADIPPAQVQADYAQSDPNAVDFIRNKPDLSLKEDKSNKATDTIDPTSTTEYPSSKAMANYTDTAIATNSGKYISDNGSPFTSAGDLPTDSSVSNNDYAVVLTGGIYYRYKATVIGSAVSWAMEYAINTNAFTPAQQAAIDSTITAVKVGNYDAHLANTTVHVTQTNKDTWNAKQNAISDLGTIRSGAQAGSTAVQPPTLAEKAEVTAAALCELKENVQGVEGDIPDVTVYAKIADLAAVAFSGDYDDLIDKPDLSVFARSADLATVATTGSYTDLLNIPANLVQDASYVHTDNNFTTTLKDKLDGIASGAEVNVQADWNQSNSAADDYIKNKPTIPAAQVQSNWNESDNTKPDFIKNKPALANVATSGSYSDLSGTPNICSHLMRYTESENAITADDISNGYFDAEFTITVPAGMIFFSVYNILLSGNLSLEVSYVDRNNMHLYHGSVLINDKVDCYVNATSNNYRWYSAKSWGPMTGQTSNKIKLRLPFVGSAPSSAIGKKIIGTVSILAINNQIN